jgi:hypothetical protein
VLLSTVSTISPNVSVKAITFEANPFLFKGLISYQKQASLGTGLSLPEKCGCVTATRCNAHKDENTKLGKWRIQRTCWCGEMHETRLLLL